LSRRLLDLHERQHHRQPKKFLHRKSLRTSYTRMSAIVASFFLLWPNDLNADLTDLCGSGTELQKNFICFWPFGL
jgi:hypothetical protein